MQTKVLVKEIVVKVYTIYISEEDFDKVLYSNKCQWTASNGITLGFGNFCTTYYGTNKYFYLNSKFRGKELEISSWENNWESFIQDLPLIESALSEIKNIENEIFFEGATSKERRIHFQYGRSSFFLIEEYTLKEVCKRLEELAISFHSKVGTINVAPCIEVISFPNKEVIRRVLLASMSAPNVNRVKWISFEYGYKLVAYTANDSIFELVQINHGGFPLTWQ